MIPPFSFFPPQNSIAISELFCVSIQIVGFPSSSVGKESACSAGDPGSIPGSGRSPEEGNGKPHQSCFMGSPWTEEPGGL